MALNVDTRLLADGRVHVEMSGKISESFSAAALLATLPSKQVVLRLAGIRHVSSMGVREFESFVGQLESVTLVEVSTAVASHLVLLPSLASRVKVESAQLPFLCRLCGAERTASVPYTATGATRNAPTCVCGNRMELDGLAEQFLPSP